MIAGSAPIKIRVGIPQPGGQLVAAARAAGHSALFSANAFARRYPPDHERAGYFRAFRVPDAEQLAGMDVALDSGGFVAATKYGDFPWQLEDYYDLVGAYPWTWHAALDYCCEPQIAADRPLRILRVAATAVMLGRCQHEAALRGLPAPMPILQGWTAAEYALCARLLPLGEWPALVGLGSVCRRQVNGPDGIIAILEAVDAVLPPHVKLHMFGIKSSALAQLVGHPRVASIDSCAWDLQARVERRTGRDMAFRIGHMHAWAARQGRIARRAPPSVAHQRLLFDPAAFGGFEGLEPLVLEAVAWQCADLLMEGQIEYRDAVQHCWTDGVIALAILRNQGMSDQTLADFDDLIAGLGERVESLQHNPLL